MSSFSSPSLCMIPGPVEMHENVVKAIAAPATSHVDPMFIKKFSEIFGKLRTLFNAASSTQPYVVAGSGTLGWDMVATNLLEPNQDALVLSTGIFGDWFGACLETYQANVTYLKPPGLGDLPDLTVLEQLLTTKPFKVITLTHVDTSTGVLLPLDDYISLIRRHAPQALVVLDAVCSAGAEKIDMQSDSIDVLITASQKALGGPPGLSIVMVNDRAMAQSHARGYYLSWARWLPIMQAYEQKRPSYFATPPVSLILALHASLTCIPPDFVKRHLEVVNLIHPVLLSHGCDLLTRFPAHTLTAFHLPSSIPVSDFIQAMREKGITIAGGVYPGLQHTYVRIGHMGVSVTYPEKHHLQKLIEALNEVFNTFGAKPRQ